MFFQKACQGSILHFMEFSASPMEHLTEGEMEINDEKIPGQEPPAFLINMPQKYRKLTRIKKNTDKFYSNSSFSSESVIQ